MLSERAALFVRSSSNAADLARICLSVRSAWTKRSLSRDAPTPYPDASWVPRQIGDYFAIKGQTFVSMRHRGNL